MTDPSGYSWFSKNWKSLTAAVVGIGVTVLTAGTGASFGVAVAAGAAGGAASALTVSLLNGSNFGQIAKNTMVGGFWGAVSGCLNNISADEDLVASLFKHTFTEGGLDALQGGNAVHGFMMGLTSSAGGYFIDNNLGALGRAGEITANSILSGLVDEIGGGKFANGAITGAFTILLNDFMHDGIDNTEVMRVSQMEKPLEPVYPEFILFTGLKLAYNFCKTACINGFESFSAFKSAYGKAGGGYNWHHIVEQTPSNIKRFGAKQIHNPNNLVKIPGGKGSIHAKISGYYSSKQPFTHGKTVRQWLSNKSYKEQYDFGMKLLKRFGYKQ